MEGLINAIVIHGNRVLIENQFTGFVFLPIVMGVTGVLLAYAGLYLENIPLIGFILSFVGFLWTAIPSLFLIYLGWLWLISFIYLITISIWLIDTTNQYDAEKEGSFNYEKEAFYDINLGRSYNLKRGITFAFATAMAFWFSDKLLPLMVSVLDVNGSNFSNMTVWTPWSFLN